MFYDSSKCRYCGGELVISYNGKIEADITGDGEIIPVGISEYGGDITLDDIENDMSLVKDEVRLGYSYHSVIFVCWGKCEDESDGYVVINGKRYGSPDEALDLIISLNKNDDSGDFDFELE